MEFDLLRDEYVFGIKNWYLDDEDGYIIGYNLCDVYF